MIKPIKRQFMNKHTFLAIALLFAISFKAYASDALDAKLVQDAVESTVVAEQLQERVTSAVAGDSPKTIIDNARSLIMALVAVPQVVYGDFIQEPVVKFASESITKVSSQLVLAKDSVAHGLRNSGASIAALPGATLNFVKANPYSLTLAALVAAGGYAGYKYATAPKSHRACKRS